MFYRLEYPKKVTLASSISHGASLHPGLWVLRPPLLVKTDPSYLAVWSDPRSFFLTPPGGGTMSVTSRQGSFTKAGDQVERSRSPEPRTKSRSAVVEVKAEKTATRGGDHVLHSAPINLFKLMQSRAHQYRGSVESLSRPNSRFTFILHKQIQCFCPLATLAVGNGLFDETVSYPYSQSKGRV